MKRLQETEAFHASDDQKQIRKQRHRRKQSQLESNDNNKDGHKTNNDCSNDQSQKCKPLAEKEKQMFSSIEQEDDNDDQDGLCLLLEILYYMGSILL